MRREYSRLALGGVRISTAMVPKSELGKKLEPPTVACSAIAATKLANAGVREGLVGPRTSMVTAFSAVFQSPSRPAGELREFSFLVIVKKVGLGSLPELGGPANMAAREGNSSLRFPEWVSGVAPATPGWSRRVPIFENYDN